VDHRVVIAHQLLEHLLHGLDAEGHIDARLAHPAVDGLGRARHVSTEMELDQLDQSRTLIDRGRPRREIPDRSQRLTAVIANRNRDGLQPTRGAPAGHATHSEIDGHDDSDEHQVNDRIGHWILLGYSQS